MSLYTGERVPRTSQETYPRAFTEWYIVNIGMRYTTTSSLRKGAILLGLLLAGCGKGSPTATPEPGPSSAPVALASPSSTSTSSASPPVQSASPPVQSAAPSAPADDDFEFCMSAELSQDRAKPHQDAPAPFAECAAGVFSHCGPEHHYCSIPFNAAKTKRARKVKPGVCCYGSL